MAICHLYVLSGEMSIQVLCSFLNHLEYLGFLLLWSYMSSLSILYINHLPHIWCAKVFSYSVGCFFILLIVSFAVFLSWCSLTYFCFCRLWFRCHIHKIAAKINAKKLFLCVFLCLQFQVLHLSLIHFKLIFVSGVR